MTSDTLASAEQSLMQLAERFEHWRQTRAHAHERIPEPLWAQAIDRVVAAAEAHGLGARGLLASPLRGASAGNVEFLLWVWRGPADMPDTALEQALVTIPEGSGP